MRRTDLASLSNLTASKEHVHLKAVFTGNTHPHKFSKSHCLALGNWDGKIFLRRPPDGESKKGTERNEYTPPTPHVVAFC